MKYFLFVFILFSCKSKDQKTNSITSPKMKIVGELMFRRSYAEIQSGKLSNKEMDALYDINPTCGGCDTLLLKKFQKLGFVKKNELLLEKIDFSTSDTVILKTINGARLTISLFLDTTDYKWKLKTKSDTLDIDSYAINSKPKLFLTNIVDRSFQELIVFYTYYIMNGDNFVFAILEFK